MSSSPSSSSSSISIAPENATAPPEITFDELASVLRDPTMSTLITHDFDDDQTGTLLLRWMVTIADGLDHHRAEVLRLRRERDFSLRYGASNGSFVRRIRGLVFIHRERQAAAESSPVPVSLPPLYDSSPPSSTYTELPEIPESTIPPFETQNSPITTESPPRTVEIMSEEDENAPSEDSLISFYTADTHEPGTIDNPIDVDLIPEPSAIHSSRPIGVRRTRSAPITMQCTVCNRTGHEAQECIRFGPTICSGCQGTDHFARDCPLWRADIRRYHPQLQFCLVCNETGHTIDRCATIHYPH